MPNVLVFGTMRDYEREGWVRLYQAAMLELEHALMAGRVVDARSEIVKRVEKLRDMPGLHNEERRAIDDALRNLYVLEQDEVRYAADEHREAVQAALHKLGQLRPAIQRLESGQSEGS